MHVPINVKSGAFVLSLSLQANSGILVQSIVYNRLLGSSVILMFLAWFISHTNVPRMLRKVLEHMIQEAAGDPVTQPGE
jgi:hypothetical protein